MTTSVDAYEKLGAFYLGRPCDLESGETRAEPLLYDSQDLLTHAVCVGMTGSGKTGLCITLLEEAAIDGVPALVIDPKGDLGNLLLRFPELRGEDFRPWIDEADAARQGLDPDAFAAQQAALWRDGLARWDQGGDRLQRLCDAAEVAIYTPGSEAGLPVSILASFNAPPAAVLADGDLLRERIATTVSSLLALLGIDADPLRSREHILLANLLDAAWRDGRDLDMAQLIQSLQSPPFERVGVLPLESFFPAKDRFELAMAINNLLAAPGFQSWMTGTPLDVDQLLYTPTGKPRLAVFSLNHLSDAERMFFVALLLNQTLGWMRGRSGTTSLRAILYMDEIFGYLPPVANPPSKQPLLTLLKQARAFGLGLVLATQNPVDLDYKALSNIGTWFLGRLQTERDKERILDGLTGAGGGLDRGRIERTLSHLAKRTFLLHNVHEEAPVLFKVRWAMSYLRGPLTRQQIQQLMQDRSALAAAPQVEAPAAQPAAPASPAATTAAGDRPLLPPEIPQWFVPLRGAGGDEIHYRPQLIGIATVHFVDSRRGLAALQELTLLADLGDGPAGVAWDEAREVDVAAGDLADEPANERASYGDVPEPATRAKSYPAWQKDLADALYRTRTYELWQSAALGQTSQPGESERDFRIRLADVAREERDAATAQLREKYGRKLDALADRIRRAEQKVAQEQSQASQQKLKSVLDIGSSLFGALLGRKKLSATNVRRASSAVRGLGRSAKESQDVARAEDDLADLVQEREALDAELAGEIAALGERFDPARAELATLTLKPRRSDVDLRLVAFAWTPWRRNPDGALHPAWE